MSRRSLGTWSSENPYGAAMFATLSATGPAKKDYRNDRDPVVTFVKKVDRPTSRSLRHVPRGGILARLYAAERADSEARKAVGR